MPKAPAAPAPLPTRTHTAGLDSDSPSRLIVSVLGAPLSGDLVASEAHRCALCAGPIHEGEPMVSTERFDQYFNSKDQVGAPDSGWACGACGVVTSKTFLTYGGKVLVSRQGIVQIASVAAQAHFILNPPPPPFVAYLGVTKMQHMAWRSRITRDVRRVYLRIGDQLLSWDPLDVHHAMERVRLLQGLMKATGIKGFNPFSRFDRELNACFGGQIRPDVAAALQSDPLAAGAIRDLEALTPGVYWAVNILIWADMKEPAVPAAIDPAVLYTAAA